MSDHFQISLVGRQLLKGGDVINLVSMMWRLPTSGYGLRVIHRRMVSNIQCKGCGGVCVDLSVVSRIIGMQYISIEGKCFCFCGCFSDKRRAKAVKWGFCGGVGLKDRSQNSSS